VHICLNELDYLPVQMWAMPKIFTYSLQTEPFIHADGDVFIWKKFDDAVESAALVAQHEESSFKYYKEALGILHAQHPVLPTALENINTSELRSLNAGVIGGNDLGFISEFCRQAFAFYNNNRSVFAGADAGKLNVVIEQLLFYRLAKAEGKPIHYLMESVHEDFSDLMQFNLVPRYQSYIHLVGSAKKNHFACNMIDRHLQYEFPDYYQQLQKVLQPPPPPVFIAPAGLSHTFFFRKTIEALRFFEPAFSENNYADAATLCNFAQQFFAEHAPEPLQPLLQELTEFENAQFSLHTTTSATIEDALGFDNFASVKKCLSEYDKQQVMQYKLKVAEPLALTLINYDIPELTMQPGWIATAGATEADEFVYLLIRHSSGVSVQKLEGSDQLLYYCSYQQMSGNELVAMLMEDENAEQNDRSYFEEVVFHFITNNLVYTGFLSFAA
jgi:hypothetical protein